jgi:hypothetical protein
MSDQPTAQDRENEARRRAIAARQHAELEHATRLALGKLGPGRQPRMKLALFPASKWASPEKS